MSEFVTPAELKKRHDEDNAKRLEEHNKKNRFPEGNDFKGKLLSISEEVSNTSGKPMYVVEIRHRKDGVNTTLKSYFSKHLGFKMVQFHELLGLAGFDMLAVEKASDIEKMIDIIVEETPNVVFECKHQASGNYNDYNILEVDNIAPVTVDVSKAVETVTEVSVELPEEDEAIDSMFPDE